MPEAVAEAGQDRVVGENRVPTGRPRAGSPLGLLGTRRLNYLRPRMWALLKEFLQFLRQEKKWWLVPLVLVLVGLAALLIFGSSSGIAWALYPFM